MKKSKFKLGFMVVGILAAMFFVLTPSVTFAGGAGPEGAYPACEDNPDVIPPIILNKAGGPVYVGNVTATWDDSNVYMEGFVSHAGKCTLTFESVLLLTAVCYDSDQPGCDGMPLFVELSAKDLVGGRLEVQTGWGTGDCPIVGSCLEIIAAANFRWSADQDSFSALFVLMPVD